MRITKKNLKFNTCCSHATLEYYGLKLMCEVTGGNINWSYFYLTTGVVNIIIKNIFDASIKAIKKLKMSLTLI